MKLYHFTSARHLYGIGLYGLTVGDVPTDIKRERGRIGVWRLPTTHQTGMALTAARPTNPDFV